MAKARKSMDRQEVALPEPVDAIVAKSTPGRTNLPLSKAPLSATTLNVDALNELLTAPSNSASVSDDAFLRRVYLDVVGQLPSPADIEDYLADRDPNKKEKLVDRLLSLPQYGRHWAKYWSDVVRYRSTNAQLARFSVYGEVDWLAEQLNQNRPWSEIVSDILTAEGTNEESPQGFFIAAHDGQAVELAGEASRIFLGTQVSCAQCHDHPYDPWKRDQFHELAAFFGKTAFRVRRDLAMEKGVPFVLEVGPVLRPRQEYRKPDLQDPSKEGSVVQPVFLTGQALPMSTSDRQRRDALAQLLTSDKNPTFSRAFVNRIWCELVGYGFVEPIDDLGPTREVRQPEVFAALSESFAASGYDVKGIFRLILLSRAYDRTIAASESESTAPSRQIARLSAAEIFTNLDWVLGGLDDGRPNLPRRRSNRGLFEQVFGFDPSMPSEEVEGTIPQALALMNHPKLEERMQSESPGTLLNKLLKTQREDRGIAQMLYLRVLGRQPTKAEIATALAHVKSSGNRAEGFEDVLWALINSTEFLHQN